ncbi:MAG: hypothetical protein ACFFD1_14485, partial [Candidatus Thorarchaeota archaeon]
FILLIGGVMLVGTIYYLGWSYRWEISDVANKEKSGVIIKYKIFFLEKKKIIVSSDVDRVQIQRIYIDELKLNKLYSLKLVLKQMTSENQEKTINLLTNSRDETIPAIAKKIITILKLNKEIAWED